MDCVSYNMAIIIQQDATEYTLFQSVKLLNMFRVVFHASSAHNTVSTVSGINETCTATCRERGWTGTSSRPATFMKGSSTVQCYELLTIGEKPPEMG